MRGEIPEGAFAGVDIGGGGIRAVVQTGERRIHRRYDGAVPRSRGWVDVPVLCEQILSELVPMLDELQLGSLTSLGIGMTGVPGLVEDPSEIDRRLRARLGFDALVVAGDAVTMHLGALGGREGAVVAAGTGVVTMGTDHRTVFRQVDGWGHLLGDEGSGAWIGRAGLEAALRAADGRSGGSRSLLRRTEEQFGGPLELLSYVYPAEAPSHVLASFAPAVEWAAREGDTVACSIWQEAGARLGRAAAAAVHGLAAKVSWGGGLFRAEDLILEPFFAEVARACPEAEVVPPEGGALDGALLLAHRALAGEAVAHPLHVHVFGPE